jgi:gamma-glutamyltranspeptidase/glutathione hydrolase
MEGRFPREVKDALADRGHRIADWPDWTDIAGCVELVRTDPATGLISAAADPRRPAYAIAG